MFMYTCHVGLSCSYHVSVHAHACTHTHARTHASCTVIHSGLCSFPTISGQADTNTHHLPFFTLAPFVFLCAEADLEPIGSSLVCGELQASMKYWLRVSAGRQGSAEQRPLMGEDVVVCSQSDPSFCLHLGTAPEGNRPE